MNVGMRLACDIARALSLCVSRNYLFIYYYYYFCQLVDGHLLTELTRRLFSQKKKKKNVKEEEEVEEVSDKQLQCPGRPARKCVNWKHPRKFGHSVRVDCKFISELTFTNFSH